MNSEFVARFMSFKGEDEYIGETNLLLEITEVEDGAVEIAFNAPIPGNPRMYVSFPFNELCERVARWGDKS